MALDLSETSLDYRCVQALSINGIDTIGQLVSHSIEDILCLPRIGKTHLSQVKKMLKKHYLSLAGNTESKDNPS